MNSIKINWTEIKEGYQDTLPTSDDSYLVTVETDDGLEVHVLEYKHMKWMHEGEATFQHGYYFHPIAWAPNIEPFKKDDGDFPLGQACDRFDPTCESCQ